jgi:AcrR family transcriptional regulator
VAARGSTPAKKRTAVATRADTRPKVRDREVIEAAAVVFARQGYAAATVQQIADELGILKGSIYYYIKSKEDVLLRLLEEVHEDLDQLLKDIDAVEGRTALERLELYVRSQAEYGLGNLTKISIYYDNLEQLSEKNRAHILARRKLHEEFVVQIILDGQREGTIDDQRDARLIAYSVFSTVIWPYRWYRPRGRIKAVDVVESCVAFVARGVAPAH